MEKLERAYPGRHFTPNGHLVGSLGEIIAREVFGFDLYPASHAGHDAHCRTRGNVEIKITAGKHIALRGPCEHLIVLKIVSPEMAEVVYDGSGAGLWEMAGKTASNEQRRLSLANSDIFPRRRLILLSTTSARMIPAASRILRRRSCGGF